MKTYIVYKWDCIIRWALFGLVTLLVNLSRIFSDVIDKPIMLSVCTIFFYFLVPVHFVLWLISLIFSIKNKQVKRTVFCAVAPIISIICLFFLIIIHVAMTGGV